MFEHTGVPVALPRGLASSGAPRLLILAACLGLVICFAGAPAKAAGLTLSQTYLSFVYTNVGQQALAQTIVASNTGAAVIPISISIVDPKPVELGVQFLQTNTCGITLAAGTSCTVSANYTPIRVGNAGATLSFGTGNPGASLSGLATALNNSNILVTVDQPANNAAVAGKITALGWAIANNDGISTNGISGITYSLDTPTNFYNTVNYGYPRADVCQVYPGRFGCPYVGWSLDLDTRGMSNGPHVLYIKAKTLQSVSKVVSAPFTVSNTLSGTAALLQVDRPAPGATLSGTASLYGWAVGALGDYVSSVQIAMDGAPIATVNVSQPRADVCMVYPNRPLCPNVGWAYLLDTTQYADGPHTLSFFTPRPPFGTTSNLNTSVPVTIANFAAAQSNPMRVTIDTPNAAMGSVAGTTTVNGWAIADDAAVSSVVVSVDGARLGNATYGVPRLDVCIAYANRAGCPNVGWSYALDTTLLADGTHELKVTALSASGKYGTIQSQFTVSNAGTNSAFHARIDVPSAGGTLHGTPILSGWAVNDNGRVGLVTISVDGIPQGSVPETISRPEACAAYPGRPGCPVVGWQYFLNSLGLADGAHVLDVKVIAGSQHATFSTPFTTANNASTNSTLIYVDQPTANSSPLSGVATVNGWALDDQAVFNGPVSISVDGTAIGAATYGLPRPDVCVVYPGRVPCPNVGWSFLFDTAMLPDGPHTLTVSAGGPTKSVSTKITIANGNSAIPKLKVYIDRPISDSPVLQGTTHMSGWAISTIPGVSLFYLNVLIDDIQSGFIYNNSFQPRPDVCSIFTTATNCPNAGWSIDMDTTQFVDGPHTLRVVATAIDSHTFVFSTAFATVPITIGNSVILNPMRLIIDGSVTGNLSGTVNLWGWAVSDDAAINTVAVSIDGTAVGNGSYGDSRDDVCAIYQNRLGCPTVGWHLPVDTTKLSNGSHTVSVTATSSLGEQTTQTATVTVKN